jgi:hypothetical protein
MDWLSESDVNLQVQTTLRRDDPSDSNTWIKGNKRFAYRPERPIDNCIHSHPMELYLPYKEIHKRILI